MTIQTPASVLPGEPAPVRLMNTIWAVTAAVHDDLTTPAALHDWLVTVDHRYAGDALGHPSPDELAEARLLRDSLRRLAAFSTDDPRPAAQSPVGSVDDAVAAVNRAVTHLPHAQLGIRGGRLHRDRPTPTSPTRVALAELAHDSIDMLTGPSATKLRACHAPGCVLYFVRSHPRREWCSETCGNRARAARHYRRVRAAL
ncbi:MAG TPA: CGNR zinc finger domain-containing protein [Mycobacterium sp.]|nr:CGNR zinc finger domain-containing protein [Mycobacterium sp.]